MYQLTTKVYITTLEKGTPPLIKTPQAVSREFNKERLKVIQYKLSTVASCFYLK